MSDEQKHKKIRLDEISKSNPFEVPEGYFDSFQNRMADRIIKESAQKQPKAVPALLRPKLIAAFSSVAVLLVVGNIFLFQKKETKTFSASELAEIIEYSAISGTSEAELINQLEISVDNPQLNDNFTDSNDEFNAEAIEYLSKEDIDLNSLIDAL
jgi:hypothetical protein